MTNGIEKQCGLPERFIERLRAILPDECFRSHLENMSNEAPTTFRANGLKTKPNDLARRLQLHGLQVKPLGWCKDGFAIPPSDRRRLTESEEHRDGLLYVQNASSMIPPMLLAPCEKDWVLDLCAAPGGKTVHLAGLMSNRGRISAVDSARPRFFKLIRNLEIFGVTNVRAYMKDGTDLWRKCEARFDKILLDAPCSAEARIRAAEPLSYRYWSVRKIAEMGRKQTRLLHSALQCLKPGGRLVYVTCSFAPEENEAVISRALDKFDGAIEAETVGAPIENWQPGFSEWNGRKYRREVRRSIRILPDVDMQGFFICVLQKRLFGRV